MNAASKAVVRQAPGLGSHVASFKTFPEQGLAHSLCSGHNAFDHVHVVWKVTDIGRTNRDHDTMLWVALLDAISVPAHCDELLKEQQVPQVDSWDIQGFP